MDRELLTWFNGRLVPDSEVRIHHTDSGLAFGHNVTDSARTFGYRPFKLKEHIRRFYLSMSVARINPGMTPERMEEIALEVLEANLPVLDPEGDVWITQTATGGRMRSTIGRFEFDPPRPAHRHPSPGGLPTTPTSTRRESTPSPPPPGTSRPSRWTPSSSTGTASSSPWPNSRSRRWTRRVFSLLLDIDGNVTENKGANFFIYRDERLRTPTTRNCLEGVSRATVLELATEVGIPAVEEDLQPYHVATAQEAFFCSTSYCMLPVTRYNGNIVGAGTAGPRLSPTARRLEPAGGHGHRRTGTRKRRHPLPPARGG